MVSKKHLDIKVTRTHKLQKKPTNQFCDHHLSILRATRQVTTRLLVQYTAKHANNVKYAVWSKKHLTKPQPHEFFSIIVQAGD